MRGTRTGLLCSKACSGKRAWSFCHRMAYAFMDLRIPVVKVVKFAAVCRCLWRAREYLRPLGKQ
jgi:hypothetical protein